jgi:hypothetical protein
MNVSTISVPHETAIQKINDIEALKKSQRTDEDDALLSVFKAVRKHNARVINIVDAFRQTGLNELGRPRLAISPSDWKDVIFESTYDLRGGSFFRMQTNTPWRQSDAGRIQLPSDTFTLPAGRYQRGRLKSAVPHIPANLRPKFSLSNYHTLFEVQNWEEYPVDPFLLKRVVGNLFIVIAEWELTELEASLLGSMRSN